MCLHLTKTIRPYNKIITQFVAINQFTSISVVFQTGLCNNSEIAIALAIVQGPKVIFCNKMKSFRDKQKHKYGAIFMGNHFEFSETLW